MIKNDTETVIVYTQAYKSQYQDSNQGAIKPVFEETADGLKPISPDFFINNELIHVTTGYVKFSREPEGQFFRVKANISSTWDKKENHDNISKYVTYDRNAEVAPFLSVCMIINAEYPEAGKVEGIRCVSKNYPIDGFFIRSKSKNDNNELIGPFNVIKNSVIKHDTDDYSFKYTTINKPIGGGWAVLMGVPHSALSFDVDLIPESAIHNHLGQDYLINPSILPFSASKFIDLSCDESLLKWASKLLRASGSDLKSKIPEFRILIDSIPIDSNLPREIIEERKSRLHRYPKLIEGIEDLRQILSDYLRSDDGEVLVRNFVDTNRDTLLEKHLNDCLEKQKSILEKRLSLELSDLNLKKEFLDKEVLILEENWNELKKSEKGMKLEELNKAIESKREEKNIIDSVVNLQTRKIVLSEDIENINEKRLKAESLLSEIQRKIQQSQETHKSNLLELKMSLDALSGNIRGSSDLKLDIRENVDTITISNIDDDARFDVIDKITSNLERHGRIISREEVAVLLVCMFQHLIITLAGKPGSGKTSTIHSIAELLSIKENNKFVHVQVQRGWSSDKELLGFYNKLNVGYDPDSYGLYKLINSMQNISLDDQFSMVLLDEANLSPIEHYWSGFMAACDNNDAFVIDNPNTSEPLKLPVGMRFIATVNYDRTTEPLSDRFLDRSPVIYLEGLNSDLFNNDYLNEQKPELLSYSFSDLDDLFGKVTNLKLLPDEERIMKEIKDEHRFISLNYRKAISITNFTSRLRSVFDHDDSDPLRAFDRAIMIFILPAINGQGREYSKALNDFHDFISSHSLTKSTESLNRILENSQFDAFSYFS